ncbi:MAG: cupredoxin domain-containing protein [Solirubrobacterales bacterium]
MTAGLDNWRRRLTLAFVATVAVASLAGLRAAAGQSATDQSATASRAASERIANFSFRPTPLTVAAGTRIVFSNQDGTSHTATQNGGGFDTGRIRPGRSAAVTFKRPGTYLFHCSIHPFMRGKIVVE